MSIGKPIAALIVVVGLLGGLLYFLKSQVETKPGRTSLSAAPQSNPDTVPEWLPIEVFLDLFTDHTATAQNAIDTIDRNWRDEYVPLLAVANRMSGNQRRKEEIVSILQKRTGEQRHWTDFLEWYKVGWKYDDLHPDFSEFLARVHENSDERFAEYFEGHPQALIKWSEIVWGGVQRDGIPPLDKPKMISADEAGYLQDSNVVFGVIINGDARCYPKRILAHHEMFKDMIGGVSVCGVYCTLCGSLIIYETEYQGKHHELGTSGFLYRSNKLMYDHATKSMWSTLEGKPVVGSLVGQGIQLQPLQCVTTSWGQWRKDHPDTTVLSLDTGHTRDYDEGAAYRSYFATDDLMFKVPELDQRLKNKDEILAVRLDHLTDRRMAIAADFLKQNRIYSGQLGDIRFVVLTDPAGGNRVYEAQDHRFESFWPDDQEMEAVVDDQGQQWTISEDKLIFEEQELKRLPAHRAFWFGWYAQFPETELVH